MVSIWTNRYSKGYTYVKNTITSIESGNWSFIEIKIDDIEVVRNTNGYRKFLVDDFLML